MRGLKFGKDYLRVTHGCGDRPFLVCVDEKKVPALHKQFPRDVIYSTRELRVLAAAKMDDKQLRTLHLTKQELPGATVEKLLPQRTQSNTEKKGKKCQQ